MFLEIVKEESLVHNSKRSDCLTLALCSNLAGNLTAEGNHVAYTGQEEDRESGLMYYKARYYDAKIGRFLQQDSMAFPNQVQGMNRMMYVEGNPVGFRDPSGNNKYIHMFNRIVGHAMGKKFGEKGINKIGKSISTGINKTVLKG
ncbi:MAG: RHS repeat-associated core domain-containing protein [Leptospira sp.]|nr:RHS repeat-associated core domain-containing protein [Leptospira sp.]